MNGDIQTSAIMSAGLRLLRQHLGVVETEIFISVISTSEFDYTEWRENLWENLSPRELFESASEVERNYTVPARVNVI